MSLSRSPVIGDHFPQVLLERPMTGERLKDILEDVADICSTPIRITSRGGDMVRCGGLGTPSISAAGRPAHFGHDAFEVR